MPERPPRRRAAALALVAVCALAFAASPVTWQTPWRAGDGAQYELTKERVDERAGRPTTRRQTLSTLAVRVLTPTAGQTGHRLGWRHTLAEPGALADLLREMPEVVLRTDADGIPEAVENLDAITAGARRIAAELTQNAPQAASAPAVAAMVQEMVSPALMQASVLSEGNTLLGYAGVEFTSGKTLEVPQELPNPLGGPAYPAVTRVRLLEHDPTQRLLRIEAVTSLDPDKARQVLVQTLERMAQRLGKPMPADAITRVDIRTTHTIDVDLRDGWPLQARTVREMNVTGADGTARRIDTSSFVRRR